MNQVSPDTVTDQEIYPILERAVAGERLGDADACRLFETNDLLALGRAAHLVRARLHPDPTVTFIIDRNINYTNVCVTGCSFCAFSRRPGDADAYVITRDEMRRKIVETREAGGNQILLQGGLHPDLPLEWYEELLRWLKAEFPGLHIHAFSPTELSFFRDRFGLELDDVIERLVAAGLDSIPGGGAEILSDRVRGIISPGKTSADDWIGIMRAAHRLGLRTTATMMLGIIETNAERVEHLRRVRDLQDETGGFTAFIPWTFQSRNARQAGRRGGATDYLKTVAIARLYLDHIQNIQASWVTQGSKIAQMALLFGVNDLGSLMLEENVVAAAGTSYKYSVAEMRRWAEELGYKLQQRDFFYHAVARA
ncbi:MAG: cyclic dehypoxanthinyl futalosine synthase [Candidatus Sumerlaeia bacterium]